jgi:glycosyltransferase involved in cell wall biosynthesis
MRITIVNYAFDDQTADPGVLLDRYESLTGWSDAIRAAGAVVSVVQRFGHDARLVRNGIEFMFRKDGRHGDPRSRPVPWRVHRAVRKGEPDLVHVNGLNVPLQTWLLRQSLAASASIVVQDHGGGVPRSGRRSLRSRAKGFAMRSADAFFFTNPAQAEAWQRAGMIGPDRVIVQVLEASTDMRPVDRAQARQESGIAGNPALLWVGRLNVNKSPLTILDAFEHALARLPAATLTMVYSGDELLPQVRARLERSEALGSHVRLIGRMPRERLAAFFSAADIFVLGSHQEGSGYALIEACACGLPSVVTDIPSFRVITGNGRAGVLWPVDDAERCCEAILNLAVQDREAWRRSVIGHFDRALSWTAVGRQAVDAYRTVIEKRRAREPLGAA